MSGLRHAAGFAKEPDPSRAMALRRERGREVAEPVPELEWQTHAGLPRFLGGEPPQPPLPPPVSTVGAAGAPSSRPRASSGLAARIRTAQIGGAPLPRSVTTRLEPMSGVDLRPVRVHADGASDGIARELGATAVSVGTDIFFRGSRYDPHSTSSGRLFANELTQAPDPSTRSDPAPAASGAAPGVSVFLQRAALSSLSPNVIQRRVDEGNQDDDLREDPLLQAKLTVNVPGDIFEQEADRVASQVMRKPEGGATGHTKVATAAAPLTATRSVRVPDAGSPLSPTVRNRVEPVLGADLGDVRVHTNPSANSAAKELRAKAFTHGSHIWLSGNQRADDVELMAHEAAHVVQQATTPGVIQRQEENAPASSSESTGDGDGGHQSFGFSEDEMEARLSGTPTEGADASAPTVEVDASTASTLNEVENEASEEGEGQAGAEAEGAEAEGAEAEGGESEGERGGERERRSGRGRGGAAGGTGGGAAPTPGPATEFEGLVSENVAAYLEGNLSDERLAELDPRTQELLEAVDLLGDRSITDPEAAALQGLDGEGLEPAAPTTGYEGEPLWLRTLATIRDVTGQLGGIVGIIGLVATVSGFILSLLIPPVGAFLLTVGRFCDVAALILDAISLVLGIILTGYNLYRLKNETNPEERRRLLGMVRQDAMGTVMSAVAVATAVAPGAGRLLGRGARRVSSGLRVVSRSSSALGRSARAIRVVGVASRRALRAGQRGVRAVGRSAVSGFRRLSRSSSLLGRAARGIRVAGVSGRLAMRSAGRAARQRATQFLGWARGTMPVRWANRLSGQAEEWTRRRLRSLAASDTAMGRFYNRRIRGFHERNVMIARSINDPIERAYQERLGRELTAELNNLRQANPTWTAQQLDDALRSRFGRERYGHAEVGTSRGGNLQFVRDDADFLREIRETEFTEIQLIRDRHPNATPAELEALVNASPFIKGRWTAEEMGALAAMHPTRRPTGELNLRDAAGDALAVAKTGHHTIPASMAPQISQDPRFLQIVNDSRFYRDVIDDAYPGMTHIPEVAGYQVPRASGVGTRAARSRREVIEHMLDQGQIPGYTRADINYFFGRQLADDLVADGSTGIWRNRRVPGQTTFFNPHLGIGHEWNWRNNVARQVFDMDSRLGLNLRRELGDQLIEPAIRRSGRVAGMAFGDNGDTRGEFRMDARSHALVDQAIQARAAARRTESPAAELPPLFESLPMEPASTDASLGETEEASSVAPPSYGPSLPPEMLEATELAGDMEPEAMEETFGLGKGAGMPRFMMGTGMSGGRGGEEGPAAPPTPVLYSPQSLTSIREQRIAIAEAIGMVNDYIAETVAAEEHNRLAGDAAGALRERNAAQGEFAQAERDTVAGEQDKLTQAGSAQENMAAENQRASSESDRGKGEADSVQAEGQNVSVEAKPEEPESKSWLERAWDATAGALWDNLVAPAVRAVRRKVNKVMQSINDFIMNMINQALGLDEIEAELNGGGQDIQDRNASLGETDAGLQETQGQAAAEAERNQQSMDQADANVADSQMMREDAQTLLADLVAHNELLESEEAAGTTYIVDLGSTYQPFFAAQEQMGETMSESPESLPAEDTGADALAMSEMSEMSLMSEPSAEAEGMSETGV